MAGKIDRILGGLIRCFGIIAGVIFSCMALIVTYNVIMRYFFSKPPVWAIEVTEYSMVYATFLAAAWILSADGHVKIDVFTIGLSSKSQRFLSIVVSFLGVVTCLLLGWFALKSTLDLYGRGVVMMKMMPWPKWVIVAPIPLGILLTLIQFIRSTIALLRGKEAMR